MTEHCMIHRYIENREEKRDQMISYFRKRLSNKWVLLITSICQSFLLQVHKLFHRLHILWISQLCHRRQPFLPHGPFPQPTLSCLGLRYHRILFAELPKTKGTDLCLFQTTMKHIIIRNPGTLTLYAMSSPGLPLATTTGAKIKVSQIARLKKSSGAKIKVLQIGRLNKSPGLVRVVSRKRSTQSAFLDSMS